MNIKANNKYRASKPSVIRIVFFYRKSIVIMHTILQSLLKQLAAKRYLIASTLLISFRTPLDNFSDTSNNSINLVLMKHGNDPARSCRLVRSGVWGRKALVFLYNPLLTGIEVAIELNGIFEA